MAETDSTRACAHCGGAIAPRINKTTGRPSKAARRYCCSRCCWAAADVRRGPRPHRPHSVRTITCHGCGVTTSRPVRRDEAGRYCSRQCDVDSKARVATERAALQRIAAAWAWRPSPLVVAECEALRRIARYVERPRAFITCCATCGGEMVAMRNGGLHRKVCASCRAESIRRGRRAGKARRRAAKRGSRCERFDPIEVLERDGWRCQLCGVSTPRRLRGTHNPRAPELDHIVPLALGGEHSRANTQCACRSCNQAKGVKAMGQLNLALAA